MNIVTGLGGWWAVAIILLLLIFGEATGGLWRKGAWVLATVLAAIATINTLSYD